MDFDVADIPSDFLRELFYKYAVEIIKIGNDKNDGYKKEMLIFIPWLIRVEKELTLRELSNGGVMDSLIKHFDLSGAMLQDAVKVSPNENDDVDSQNNPSSRGVSSADIEYHNEGACGDEDSSALYTMRVAKSYESDSEKSGSRPYRNRNCNTSRNVPCTPWLYKDLRESVIKKPDEHWKVRYEDPPPPKRRK